MDFKSFKCLIPTSVFLILFLSSCYPHLKLTKHYIEDGFPIKDGFELFVGDVELMLKDSISLKECHRILCVPNSYESRFTSGEFQSEEDYWIAIFKEEDRTNEIRGNTDWNKVIYFNQNNQNHIWITRNSELDKWEVHNKFPVDLNNDFFYCFRLIDVDLGLEPFMIFVYSHEKETFISDYDSTNKISFY